MSKKQFMGEVVTIHGKTIGVLIRRSMRHPKYSKSTRIQTKFLARDENSLAQIGNTVEIIETKPFSKKVSWQLKKVITK